MQIKKGRVGLFLLVIGLVLFAIFFTTSGANNPQLGFFFSGLLFAAVGVYLMWRDAKPPPPSSRFRVFKQFKRKEKK